MVTSQNQLETTGAFNSLSGAVPFASSEDSSVVLMRKSNS